MSRRPAESLQRRRLYRWVAAVGLLTTAEDHRGADVPETNAMGLMGAHAAAEAMLGLLAGHQPYTKGSPREPEFPDLLKRAAERGRPRLSDTLRGELMAMHSVRNAFVHGGSFVDGENLDRAIDAAHSLAEHVPLPGHDRLVGVPTVVAAIIDMEAVGMWLRFADEQRLKGDLRYSADGIARALDRALDRTVPRVRTRTGRSWRSSTVRGCDQELARAIETAAGEAIAGVNQLTQWVYPLALGTSPATLDYIRSVVGAELPLDLGGYPSSVQRPSADPPSTTDLRRASSLVSRIILRLSVMGGLEARQGDDQIVALAREALADPVKAMKLGLPAP